MRSANKSESASQRIAVTRHPRALCAVPSQPRGQELVYQLARIFQLSSTEIGLLVGIRWSAIRPVDIEVGNDLVIVDRSDDISPKATVPLNRGEIGVHPRTGGPLLLSRYPIGGGFVPLGALRSDGTPHPYAGTGFAISHIMGYPVDASGNIAVYGLWEVPMPDRHFMIELQQYRYDGMQFTIKDVQLFVPDMLFPGWEFTCMPLGNCLSDGDDLIGSLVARPAGSKQPPGSGLIRWQYRSGQWSPASFTPVTGADGSSEPSLIRDFDGSLLFTARGAARIEVECVKDEMVNCYKDDIRVWRSADGGSEWGLTLHVPKVRAGTPVSINKALDGTVYIAGNPYMETDSFGRRLSSNEMRETLILWPLSDDRRQLLDPVLARDSNADFGAPPYGSIWRVDHPIGLNVRLADGKWHHLLAYRVLELNECVSDSPVTAHTGTYIEEVLTPNLYQPEWRFA